ncbi:MAG: TolC family protein, partial [Spirochaetales bacterium]|nr:TolC family protein [Spirochaetales bacterium]
MRVCILFTYFCILSFSAEAEDYTLARAREKALENSAAVRKAELSVRTASLDRVSAVADFFPSLSASGSMGAAYPKTVPTGEESGFDTSASVGLSANQTIFSGGSSRIIAMQQNTIQGMDAQEVFRAARLTVLADANTRYLAVLEKAQKKEAADKDLEAAGRRLELARARFETGRADRSELLQVESSYAAKDAAAVRARYEADISRRSFASLLGVSADFNLADLDEGEYTSLWETCAALSMNEIDGKAALLLKYGEDKNPDLLRKDLA